jgi:hypothetical protein
MPTCNQSRRRNHTWRSSSDLDAGVVAEINQDIFNRVIIPVDAQPLACNISYFDAVKRAIVRKDSNHVGVLPLHDKAGSRTRVTIRLLIDVLVGKRLIVFAVKNRQPLIGRLERHAVGADGHLLMVGSVLQYDRIAVGYERAESARRRGAGQRPG